MSDREAVVANINDLQDGEMKQVSVGETEVLLARIEGKFHAVGAHCKHYRAPLAEGVISGDRIICPWHNADFSSVTGDQYESPGLDSLPCYQVRLDKENVIITLPESVTAQRIPSMAKYNPDVDTAHFCTFRGGCGW